MSKLSDAKMVLKGMTAVGKAILERQRNECVQSGHIKSLEDITKSTRITVEKLSMVTMGLRQMAKIMIDSGSRLDPLAANQFSLPTTVASNAEEISSPLVVRSTVTEISSNAAQSVKLESSQFQTKQDANSASDSYSPPIERESFDNISVSVKPDAVCEVPATLPSSHSAFPGPIIQSKPIEKRTATVDVSRPKNKTSALPVEHNQKLNEKSRESKVPASRVGRLVSYGGLAAGLGVGALAELARRAVQGPTKDSGSVLLNEANAERIVTTLCKVRGGALKLGQMLSIQDNAMISPELQKAFERVRQSADFMPWKQTEKVLIQELGSEWRTKFQDFHERPFAAASIGQVHVAVLPDGQKVAVKIQYPGVAKGIDSDIRNLATTLKVWKILPPGLFVDNVMAVARRELALEVDYEHEAKCSRRFRELVEPYPEYHVPHVVDDLSTKEVLTTELIEGLPLDRCTELPQDTRNKIIERVLRLCLLELFVFRFMQTDPNWSNFFFDPSTDTVHLLDFGSSREYPKTFVDNYMRVMRSAIGKDVDAVLKHSQDMGFLTGYESKVMKDAHVQAVTILGEVFAYDGDFDFGQQNTSRRIHSVIPVMLEHRMTPPPEETYSLHRKLAGIFLLSSKLRAQVNCKKIFDDIYSDYRFDD